VVRKDVEDMMSWGGAYIFVDTSVTVAVLGHELSDCLGDVVHCCLGLGGSHLGNGGNGVTVMLFLNCRVGD